MPYILLFLALMVPAQAYIDPNTGGMIMQILTPLLLVIGVAWTTLRRKITELSSKLVAGIRSAVRFH